MKNLKTYESWFDDEDDDNGGVTEERILSTDNYYMQKEMFYDEGPYYEVYDNKNDNVASINPLEEIRVKEDVLDFKEGYSINRITLSELTEFKELMEKFREYYEISTQTKKYNL